MPELGESKISEMITNGQIWNFKYNKYKDEIKWDKSMNIIKEANKKGHVLIEGLQKDSDGDIVFKIKSSGVGKMGGIATL